MIDQRGPLLRSAVLCGYGRTGRQAVCLGVVDLSIDIDIREILAMMRTTSRGRGRWGDDGTAATTNQAECADYPRGQSRMTLVRRELPPSRNASRPDWKTGRRIADTRTLQSCPHRASADATQEIQPTFLSLSHAGG